VSRISILSPLVAERIAAGEVVERPSSVVKELVENSLDAGATEISIRLEDGGKALIEILDNGFGMGRKDLDLAVLRHATSKIREVSDLERLATLGFRGEALPSIAACADLSILSREKDSTETYEWRDGRVDTATFGNFHASKHGTRMQVRSLFSQIPARLKFLKSATGEIAAVREWIERLALTNPSVGFKLETEARTLLHYRPETEASRVARVLGDDGDFPVITEEVIEAGAIRARIHWIQGATSPQMRKMVQAVNGRAVRDRLLNQAILTPFRQALLPGQFPWLALFLDVPPALIDVNVHPTKTELRFLNASQIFRTIERLGEGMIGKHGSIGFAAGSHPSSSISAGGNSSGLGPAFSGFTGDALYSASQPAFFATAAASLDAISAPADTSSSISASGNASVRAAGNASVLSYGHPFTPDRFVGGIFQTYFLYDLGTEMALIDQHAAHERIRFERLRSRALRTAEGAESQALLVPETARFPAENRARIEARLPLLETLGFEAELFGGTGDHEQLLFRAIPAEWGSANLRTRLLTLVEKLGALEDSEIPKSDAHRILKLDEKLFEKLASEACHSAVRAGDRLDDESARTIVDALFECEHPWNCPHGRPTVARVPRARFEEWFQRRV
jgi:DNA mismatch repair protein MutL